MSGSGIEMIDLSNTSTPSGSNAMDDDVTLGAGDLDGMFVEPEFEPEQKQAPQAQAPEEQKQNKADQSPQPKPAPKPLSKEAAQKEIKKLEKQQKKLAGTMVAAATSGPAGILLLAFLIHKYIKNKNKLKELKNESAPENQGAQQEAKAPKEAKIQNGAATSSSYIPPETKADNASQATIDDASVQAELDAIELSDAEVQSTLDDPGLQKALDDSQMQAALDESKFEADMQAATEASLDTAFDELQQEMLDADELQAATEASLSDPDAQFAEDMDSAKALSESEITTDPNGPAADGSFDHVDLISPEIQSMLDALPPAGVESGAEAGAASGASSEGSSLMGKDAPGRSTPAADQNNTTPDLSSAAAAPAA